MQITQITDAIRGKSAVNPKTVLGFYATVCATLVAGGGATVAVLASTGQRVDLIPYILVFCGLAVVALLIGVFAVTLSDPSKLMLTQVSGEEYAVIRRVTLGDSGSGTIRQLLSEDASSPSSDAESRTPADSHALTIDSARNVNPSIGHEQ